MNYILIDIWNQITDLSSTQWILVVALSCIFRFVIFRVFHWIYQQRLESQNQVIASGLSSICFTVSNNVDAKGVYEFVSVPPTGLTLQENTGKMI